MNKLMSLDEFPNSFIHPFIQTSPDVPTYNCIAWAYGDASRFYWPVEHPDAYWPPGITKTVQLSSFIELYSSIGYKICNNGDLVANMEKVAIYTDLNGTPTHAARQLDNGLWTSKLGKEHDVSHTIIGIGNGVYGNISVFMERPRHIGLP